LERQLVINIFEASSTPPTSPNQSTSFKNTINTTIANPSKRREPVLKYVEGRTARMICVRLTKGEDLLTSIRNVAEKTGVTSGAFFAIGTFTKATFYFYHPKPKTITIEKPLEIVSCSGSISKAGEKTIVHGHLDVTDEEYKSYGGHLLEGSIIDRMGFVAIFELIGANLADLEK